jgi:hypothetical protein
LEQFDAFDFSPGPVVVHNSLGSASLRLDRVDRPHVGA